VADLVATYRNGLGVAQPSKPAMGDEEPGHDETAKRLQVAELLRSDEEIDERVAWLDEKEYPGLPVIWIENQGLLGAQTYAALRAAWQRAERYKAGDGV
jgi:hypothetical protein